MRKLRAQTRWSGGWTWSGATLPSGLYMAAQKDQTLHLLACRVKLCRFFRHAFRASPKGTWPLGSNSRPHEDRSTKRTRSTDRTTGSREPCTQYSVLDAGKALVRAVMLAWRRTHPRHGMRPEDGGRERERG